MEKVLCQVKAKKRLFVEGVLIEPGGLKSVELSQALRDDLEEHGHTVTVTDERLEELNRDELREIAREMRLQVGGSKEELLERIYTGGASDEGQG